MDKDRLEKKRVEIDGKMSKLKNMIEEIESRINELQSKKKGYMKEFNKLFDELRDLRNNKI